MPDTLSNHVTVPAGGGYEDKKVREYRWDRGRFTVRIHWVSEPRAYAVTVWAGRKIVHSFSQTGRDGKWLTEAYAEAMAWLDLVDEQSS